MRKIAAVALMLFMLGAVALADRVVLMMLNEEGTAAWPLNACRLTVFDENEAQLFSQTSDGNGEVLIEGLEMGTYSATLEVQGGIADFALEIDNTEMADTLLVQ
jgi:hypothetical protein